MKIKDKVPWRKIEDKSFVAEDNGNKKKFTRREKTIEGTTRRQAQPGVWLYTRRRETRKKEYEIVVEWEARR